MSRDPALEPTRCKGCGRDQVEVCWSVALEGLFCLRCSKANGALAQEPSEQGNREVSIHENEPLPLGDQGSLVGPLGPLVTADGSLVTHSPEPDGSLVTGASGGSLVTHGSLVTDKAERNELLLRHLGAQDDGSLPCLLPGHTEPARLEVPSDDPKEELRLRCCCGRWRSLGEVRAARAYGEDDGGRPGGGGGFSNIEIAIWTRRLWYEAGAFHPVDVELPELPAEASDHAERARAGFALLLGLRWADFERRPAAYSVRFCKAWNDLTFREAHEALGELHRGHVLRVEGKAGRSALYMPGAGPSQ